MVTLKFVLEQLNSEVPGGIGRYAENLAREVIRRAPANCEVVGLVARSEPDQLARLRERLPGLVALQMAGRSRRVLSKSWQHGLLTNAFDGGMIHAPSLFAPLRDPSSGELNQTVVTVHDAVPWTHPETLTPNGVRWHRAQLRRAWQYAAAIVTPTHAVADQIAEIHDFGDRLRVIPGAASPDIALPVSEEDRESIAARLALPDSFILAVGTLEPRKGIDRLIAALAEPELADAVLVHVGPPGWGEVDIDALCAAAGVTRERVLNLGFLDDTELAVVLDRATVLCMPSRDEGFGLPLLEAFRAGTATIHTDVPALNEVSQQASLVVPVDPDESFEHRLAISLSNVLSDDELRQMLVTAGHDRDPVYSWEYSADLVWRLHAEI